MVNRRYQFIFTMTIVVGVCAATIIGGARFWDNVLWPFPGEQRNAFHFDSILASGGPGRDCSVLSFGRGLERDYEKKVSDFYQLFEVCSEQNYDIQLRSTGEYVRMIGRCTIDPLVLERSLYEYRGFDPHVRTDCTNAIFFLEDDPGLGVLTTSFYDQE